MGCRKEFEQEFKLMEKRGWSISRTGGDHFKCVHEQCPTPVFAPSTPSSRQSIHNFKALVRKVERNFVIVGVVNQLSMLGNVKVVGPKKPAETERTEAKVLDFVKKEATHEETITMEQTDWTSLELPAYAGASVYIPVVVRLINGDSLEMPFTQENWEAAERLVNAFWRCTRLHPDLQHKSADRQIINMVGGKQTIMVGLSPRRLKLRPMDKKTTGLVASSYQKLLAYMAGKSIDDRTPAKRRNPVASTKNLAVKPQQLVAPASIPKPPELKAPGFGVFVQERIQRKSPLLLAIEDLEVDVGIRVYPETIGVSNLKQVEDAVVLEIGKLSDREFTCELLDNSHVRISRDS